VLGVGGDYHHGFGVEFSLGTSGLGGEDRVAIYRKVVGGDSCAFSGG